MHVCIFNSNFFLNLASLKTGATKLLADNVPKAISPYSESRLRQTSKSSSACGSQCSLTKADTLNGTGVVISKTFSNKPNQQTSRFEVPKPLQPPVNRGRNLNHDSSRSQKHSYVKPLPATCNIGIKRIVDEPKAIKQSPIKISSVVPPRKSSPQKQIGAHSVDLFDDDDDDLLRTIAEQVESQYGKKFTFHCAIMICTYFSFL